MAQNSKLERFVPVLLILVVVMAFGLGVMWQKVSNLEKGGAGAVNTAPTTTTNQPAQAAASPTTVDLTQIKALFSKDLIKFGDPNSKVLFVEVSDPSCPYCHVATGLNSTLNTQMGAQFKLVKDGGTYVAPVQEMKKLVDAGKAAMVYIYSPGHGNGEMGMKALYCAYEQNKFWETESLLMTSAGYDLLNTTVKNDKAQSQTVADFLKSAVDETALKTCLDSGKYDARLSSDAALASSLNVNGTPGFYVNEKLYAGAYSYTDMKSSVDALLQ